MKNFLIPTLLISIFQLTAFSSSSDDEEQVFLMPIYSFITALQTVRPHLWQK